MANKRRPKKVRPPYKRYVYGSNFTEVNSSDEEREGQEYEGEGDDEVEGSNIKDIYGNSKHSNFKNHISITSVYVLTSGQRFSGSVWPRSQFEKVDVLRCCLNKGNPEYEAKIKQALQIHNQQKAMMCLPIELIVTVLDILHAQGELKPKFMRVSKLFYSLVRPFIYQRPKLKATNFFSFVDTISSSKTIGNYVQELDLSYIIQSGKNAFVAKLLKRSSKNLNVFVAPQTSFGLGPLIALKNCLNLKVLDLRLVSETLNLQELFKSISNLNNLTHLSFPRSSIEIQSAEEIVWPPKLSFLRLSGGISDDFLMRTSFPDTITQLEFAHCPAIKDLGFNDILIKHGRNLKSLKVQYPMPGFKDNSLDNVFSYCPNLLVVELAVDYVSSSIFDEENLPHVSTPRPLRTMYIDSSGMLGTSTKLDPLDLAMALSEDRLPHLKNLQCTAKLGWNPESTGLSYIVDELEERNGGVYIGW